MTTQSVMRVLRTLAALPEDDFKPEHWASLMAARETAIDEVARYDRAQTRKATADVVRRGFSSTARRKPDPPGLVAAKRQVLGRSEGLCEAKTPWCDRYATQVHHIAGRKGSTAHDAVNLLAVCGIGNTSGCHGYIHQHPDEARERGWLRAPDALPPVVDTKGTR